MEMLKATGIMERPPACEDEKHRDFELHDVLSDVIWSWRLQQKTAIPYYFSSRSDAPIHSPDLPLTGPEHRPEFGIKKPKIMESPTCLDDGFGISDSELKLRRG